MSNNLKPDEQILKDMAQSLRFTAGNNTLTESISMLPRQIAKLIAFCFVMLIGFVIFMMFIGFIMPKWTTAGDREWSSYQGHQITYGLPIDPRMHEILKRRLD